MQPTEHWHETRRGPVFARHWGDPHKPRLLMLHGFPEYSMAFAALAPRLTSKFYCIAPDQRGYGQTVGPDDVSAYTTRALVSDMVDLIGDDPVTVLGHDWGAGVAYGLAMFAPDLVDRLIVMNGVHPVPFQCALARGGAQAAASQYILTLRREGSERWLAQNGYEKLIQLFSAHMDLGWMTKATRDAYVTEWARPGRLKTMIHWYRASPVQVPPPGKPLTNLREYPPEKLRIQCPHLLIWGMDDTALLPETTEDLELFAPDLTRVEITGADHWIAHQKPQDVADAILAWHP